MHENLAKAVVGAFGSLAVLGACIVTQSGFPLFGLILVALMIENV